MINWISRARDILFRQESSPENLSSESIATVLKQLKDLQVVPAEGINVSLALFWYVSRLTCQPYRRSTSVRTILRKFSLIYKARVRLNCVLPLCFQLSSPADGTPFHNGTFKMKLILPTDYPRCPPRGENVKSVCHGCCLHKLFIFRIFCYKNFPPKCAPTKWRDLRKYVEKRLETRPWSATCFDGDTLPPNRTFSRVRSEWRRCQAYAWKLRRILQTCPNADKHTCSLAERRSQQN